VSPANEEQRAKWNDERGLRWVADADRRDAILAPVADVLLGAAALSPGEGVLDVGCGCGATTLAAARAVAPGPVIGLDLSAPMLGVARDRAARTGSSADFVEGDAQTHAFEPRFDVVMSRFGTMFFDDPAAAFANLASAAVDSGRLCLATWQPLVANEWLALPAAALQPFGDLSDVASAGPGMFAQSDPGVVDQLLRAAGWHDVSIEPVALELPLGRDVADAVDYVTATSIVRDVLDPLPDAERAAAITAVAEAIAPRQSADGVRLGANVLVISASRTRATR
jgi:SAM-dependent methyltransferase